MTTRRAFLLGAAAVPVAAACSQVDGERPSGRGASSTSAPAAPAAPSTTSATSSIVPVAERRLVIVELPGGNDGLSTLVPLDDGRYHDLRPTVAVAAEDATPFTPHHGLHPALAGLADGALAVVDGLGARRPSMSHFDMMARWWAGTPDSNAAAAVGESGFAGRICDAVGVADSLTGVSIGLMPSPAMASARRTTVGLPDNAALGSMFGGDATAAAAFTDFLSGVGHSAATPPGAASDVAAAARGGLLRMLDVDAALVDLAAPSGDYDTADPVCGRFAAQMSFASQLLRSGSGVRVIHVTADGVFFDTHERHRHFHDLSLAAIAPGLAAFRRDLASHGLTDRVLIATTSEFGRRAKEHNGGLDHGTSSCALLMGPVRPGVGGEHPSLRRLDRDGNLRAPIAFDRYLATLATWMDVDPARVLDGSPAPLPSLLA